jgi:hypothetical protein
VLMVKSCRRYQGIQPSLGGSEIRGSVAHPRALVGAIKESSWSRIKNLRPLLACNSEQYYWDLFTVKAVLLRLIYRKTGIILHFWCFLVLLFRQRRPQKGTYLFLGELAGTFGRMRSEAPKLGAYREDMNLARVQYWLYGLWNRLAPPPPFRNGFAWLKLPS